MNKTANQDRSRELDQFYTNPDYAKSFYNRVKKLVDLDSSSILLEPSAGSGNFYYLLDPNKRIGLDLDPKSPDITKQDFFSWVAPFDEKIITIGNPPFGKNSNLAVKFFNRAAEFSDAIAFVLPRTFRKASIINRLNKKFHLIYEEIVPDNSFVYNNKPYDVWCCSQIWVKKDTNRPKIKILKFQDVDQWFKIVSPDSADFSIQRVGGGAGCIRTENFSQFSQQSHYFIKALDPRVLDIFQKINFDEVKFNTVGNPSVSPSELIKLWIETAKMFDIIVNPTNNSNKESNIISQLFYSD